MIVVVFVLGIIVSSSELSSGSRCANHLPTSIIPFR